MAWAKPGKTGIPLETFSGASNFIVRQGLKGVRGEGDLLTLNEGTNKAQFSWLYEAIRSYT